MSRGAGGGFGDDATELDDEDPTAKRVEQQRQRQEDSPQGEGQDRGRSCCCPPFVEGRLATVVLVAAMLCRIGDYSQASFLFFLVLDEFLRSLGNVMFPASRPVVSFWSCLLFSTAPSVFCSASGKFLRLRFMFCIAFSFFFPPFLPCSTRVHTYHTLL